MRMKQAKDTGLGMDPSMCSFRLPKDLKKWLSEQANASQVVEAALVEYRRKARPPVAEVPFDMASTTSTRMD